MSKKPTIVQTCLNCQENEMLEVRKHAGELFDCMSLLSETYCINGKRHRKGVTVPEYVEKLIAAEQELKRLQAIRRAEAERKLEELGSLVSAMRFMGDVCNNGTNAVSLTGSGVTVDMSRVFATAVRRLQSLEAGYRGLIQGMQKHAERDFVGELMEPKA
jgi:hypothetical protein